MEAATLTRTDDDAPAPDPVVSGSSDASDARRQKALVVLVVALLCGLFLANAASWLAAGFGESHDGRNAATWAAGSRAIREDGIVESRFGSRYQDGVIYASHPPGLVAETTVAELAGGEHRLVTRLPAVVASIATAVLLALILWELGLSAGAIAMGLATALGSAMFLVYGTMLDTPITALPWALAVVLVTQRIVDGRKIRPWVLGLLGLAVALNGWAAVAIAGVQAIRLALPTVRRRVGWWPALATLLGLGVGVVISLGWSLWAYGSFAVMRAKLTDKTNSDSLIEALHQQSRYLGDLLALGLVLAVVGAVLAWVALPDRRWWGPVWSLLTAIVVYAVALHGGAAMHDYWNYALIVPVAIAVAAGAEALLRRVPASDQSRAQVVVVVLALVFAVLSSTRLSDAEAQLENGLATTRLLQVAEQEAPADGPVLAYVGTRGLPSSWIPYEARRPALVITSTAQLEDLVADQPGFPVLVPWVAYDAEGRQEAKDQAYGVDGPYAVVPASFVLSQRTDR
ncbi:MAG: hypothetical protein ACTHN0_19215 [Aquihabitans sp.]